jgi:integrase
MNSLGMTVKSSSNLAVESFSDQDWLNDYTKERTRGVASTSLKVFDMFCQKQIGLNGESKDVMINQYKLWFKPLKVKDDDGDYYYPDSDVRSICLSLKKFIVFMGQSHEDIVVYNNSMTGADMTFKKKSPRSIKLYFGFVKTYLRICHGIKLTNEDIKDYVKLEKPPKEARQPIPLDVLKTMFDRADSKRRCMYLCLISSGMRIGEAMALKKSNFITNENPVRVILHAKDTKTNESRETYISSEAFEKLKPILDSKGDDDFVFNKYPTVYSGVKNEIKYFMTLRRRLNLDIKIDNSIRAVYTLHGLRGYFHTKATQVHGEQYANRLDGHTGYLPQYYQLSEKERGDMYLKLEPELFIESIKTASDENKDKLIEDLTEKMAKMEAKMQRFEILSN